MKNFSWSFTNKCNLKCLHCIVSSGKEQDGELTTAEAQCVIDQLKNLKCGCIHFTGGECLTKQNFSEVVEYCKKKGIKATLVTNATLINEDNIDFIKNAFNDVRVSLNGASSETHDKIRGVGNFNRTIKAIKLLNKANVPLIFFISLGNINISEMHNIINLCKEYKAVGLKIDEIVLEGRAIEHECLFNVDEEQTRWLVQEFSKSFNGELHIDDDCNINSESFYLSANGNVYPCVHLCIKNRTDYNLGNVKEVPLEQMIKKFEDEVYPKCKGKKCVHKFYSIDSFHILGIKNENCKDCLPY